MIIILGVILSGCEEEDFPIEDNDEYYVKYIVNSSTPYNLLRDATITYELNTRENFTFDSTNWEMTIGPVEKGFIATCNARFDKNGILARTHINVEIYVRKNNEPFVWKSGDTSTDVRMSASANYTLY